MHSKNPIYLGVNVDHVATLRQARGEKYPDPLYAALIAEKAGADGITIHLREDRRHIQDRDVFVIKEALQTRLNLEMGCTDAMIDLACKVKPAFCCLVPEKREELTTEGGLDVINNMEKITEATTRLQKEGILVSLFIDPDENQIKAAHETNAAYIELHTGEYAKAQQPKAVKTHLQQLIYAAKLASELGLNVNAGHGLHYHNTQAIAQIPQLEELNIGHAIVAHALFVGFENAVREMKQLMVQARNA